MVPFSACRVADISDVWLSVVEFRLDSMPVVQFY
jgi:hypothetical protein